MILRQLCFLPTVFLATVVWSCATFLAGVDVFGTPKCFARTELLDLRSLRERESAAELFELSNS